MLPVIRIFNKVIVGQFYQQHAGLLLFVFFIMFGIVEGSQLVYYHLSLIYGMLDSPIFLGMVLFIWALYSFKCIQFTKTAMSLPQNSFLFCITGQPVSQQYLELLICQSMLLIPVISYALILIGVAIHLGNLLIALLIVVYLLMLCAIAALISFHKINSPATKTELLSKLIPLNRKKALWQFYFAYIFSERKMIFMVTKVFSYLTLFGFFMIDVGHYEIRTAYMGLLIGLVSHLVLIFEFRKWEDSYLPFIKNLPIPLWKRYLTLAVIYCVILTPELILIALNRVVVKDFAALALFGTSFLLFLHGILYRVQMDMDRYIQWAFLLFLISFGLVLFQLSWLVTLVSLTISYRWFNRYFYSFEALRL